MGVYEELSWLDQEKTYIGQAVASGALVLGICLGAQLIANVLGAKVYPHTQKEIGWWPLSLTREGHEHPLFSHLPPQLSVLHWHGDTFDLPDDAILLATSSACKHQAFINGKGNAIGLQFHMEADEQMVKDFVQHDQTALIESGTWVQGINEILSGKTSFITQNRKLLFGLLDKWAWQTKEC